MPIDLSQHLDHFIRRRLASGVGTSWVVGVSGGGDSVALIRLLNDLALKRGLTLSIAHLNHHARGIESEADAAFVAALAGSLKLPFHLGDWQANRPGHFEADARAARHAFLAEVARSRRATVVALGHTRDDQVETILHRIVRGTGIHGLAGIPARRTFGQGLTLVRPLLDVSREVIRAYLAEVRQDFRDDATNTDVSRTRARLRHDLLPRLAAEYNPNIDEALIRLARLAAGSTRTLQKLIQETERAVALPGEAMFSRERLAGLPRFLRAEVIRSAWRRAAWPEAGMSAARWERIARLVLRTEPGKVEVGAGIVAVNDGVVFMLRREVISPTANRSPEPVALPIPGVADWQQGRIHLTLDPEALCDETIDLDCISPPVFVRAPMIGDRFEPLGMGGNGTPLNDFFRGRHVIIADRNTTPLVCDSRGIFWVVGHRIADRVKITELTGRRAGLRWDRLQVET